MKLFWESRKHLKTTKGLAIAAMCIALSFALTQFRIQLSSTLQIGFTSLSIATCAYFLGGIPTILVAVISDILLAFLFPSGPFFPGFTLNQAIVAIIYSTMLYKKEISIPRILIARVLIVVIINLILTPLWLNMLYEDAASAFNKARIIKQLITFPFDALLLYGLLNILKKIYIKGINEA